MPPADEGTPIGPGTSGDPDMTAPASQPARRSRIRRVFSGSRDLWRVVYRDPEHVPERLTLYTANRLGDASREWAQSVRSSHPDTPVAKIAEELRTQSAHVARIDGAISGTPFFIALVPGYLTYLQQEMRTTLRTAALYGRDPRELAHLGRDARAARGAPGRRGRGGRADFGPRQGLPRSSGTPAIVAHMGS